MLCSPKTISVSNFHLFNYLRQWILINQTMCFLSNHKLKPRMKVLTFLSLMTCLMTVLWLVTSRRYSRLNTAITSHWMSFPTQPPTNSFDLWPNNPVKRP